MVHVSKEQVADWLLLETMANSHVVNDRLESFKNKYSIDFDIFEKKVKTEEENFEWWDDYMAWKACLMQSEELKQRMKDLKNGIIEIA